MRSNRPGRVTKFSHSKEIRQSPHLFSSNLRKTLLAPLGLSCAFSAISPKNHRSAFGEKRTFVTRVTVCCPMRSSASAIMA